MLPAVVGVLMVWVVSVCRHPRNGALLIVSNPGRQEGRATLKPDWKALEIDIPRSVLDDLTRSPLPLKDGAIEFSLPAAGWKYIWVQRGKQ